MYTNLILKESAFISMESFGSDIPDNWEEIAERVNNRINAIPEDVNGCIDRDTADGIWEDEISAMW